MPFRGQHAPTRVGKKDRALRLEEYFACRFINKHDFWQRKRQKHYNCRNSSLTPDGAVSLRCSKGEEHRDHECGESLRSKKVTEPECCAHQQPEPNRGVM